MRWSNSYRARQLLCRFSDAGNDDLTTRSGGRRPKSAKARNRGRWAAAGPRAMGISPWAQALMRWNDAAAGGRLPSAMRPIGAMTEQQGSCWLRLRALASLSLAKLD